eukprot:3831331-Amphidinium_carterae.1
MKSRSVASGQQKMHTSDRDVEYCPQEAHTQILSGELRTPILCLEWQKHTPAIVADGNALTKRLCKAPHED